MDESVLGECSLPSTEQLRGSWTLDGGVVWIGVDKVELRPRRFMDATIEQAEGKTFILVLVARTIEAATGEF
jgi:hypothetical protein